MNKSKLLQVRIQQLIDYVLHNTTKGRSGPYSQAELAEELKVPRSLITHIVKGRRTLKLSKLERLEELTGMEVFTIQNPELFGKTTLKHLTEEKVNLEVRTLMKSKFNGLEFYEDLLKAIRSQFEVDYPDVFIEERINSQQYVSLNIYGNIIREKLQKRKYCETR